MSEFLLTLKGNKCNMTVSHNLTAGIIVHSCHGTKRTFIMYFQS